MRLHEILREDYNSKLASDLTNLLVAARASGATRVKTATVVGRLVDMGYSVDSNSILSLLSSNPVVTNATTEFIELVKTDTQSAETGSVQDSAAHVRDMARRAVDIG